MNKKKPKTYAKTIELVCDWTDKTNYSIQYRMVSFYVRHGMRVDKTLEIISFKPTKWLERNISLNTKKRNQAEIDFENDFYKLLVNAVFGKMMENVRNCL